MSFLGGIMKSIINPATLMQLAMGPAGWASIAAKAVMTAVAQQVIQKLGQELGLPPIVINMAQQAFAQSAGLQNPGSSIPSLRDTLSSIGQSGNFSPTDMGSAERLAHEGVDRIFGQMTESKEFKEAKAGGGKSWLMAIAEALGRTADKLAKEMDDMSQKLGTGDEKSKASDNLKFGAKSQEFNQFFSAANTVIKGLGEALASGARKS